MPAQGLRAAAAGLLFAAALAWLAVARGAANLDGVGPLAFAGAWTLMMAAMMLPSAVPSAAAVAQVARRQAATAEFAAGYLLAWGLFGAAIALILEAGRSAGIDLASPVATAGVLLVAAVYELTPAKSVCLRRCRHPLGFVVAHWSRSPLASTRMGVLLGLWCGGCCWALMAVLLAVGAMSIGWMLLVAALVAAENLLPSEPVAIGAVTTTLVALAALEVAI